MCNEISGDEHAIHTEYNTESGVQSIDTSIKKGGRDDALIIKVLREINDDFHDANKITLALNSTILEKLVT